MDQRFRGLQRRAEHRGDLLVAELALAAQDDGGDYEPDYDDRDYDDREYDRYEGGCDW